MRVDRGSEAQDLLFHSYRPISPIIWKVAKCTCPASLASPPSRPAPPSACAPLSILNCTGISMPSRLLVSGFGRDYGQGATHTLARGGGAVAKVGGGTVQRCGERGGERTTHMTAEPGDEGKETEHGRGGAEATHSSKLGRGAVPARRDGGGRQKRRRPCRHRQRCGANGGGVTHCTHRHRPPGRVAPSSEDSSPSKYSFGCTLYP